MLRPWPRAALVPASAVACLVAVVCLVGWRCGGASEGFHRQEHLSVRPPRLKATLGTADTLCEQSCRGCSFAFEGPVFDRSADFLLMFNYGKVASETMRWSLMEYVLHYSKVVYLSSSKKRKDKSSPQFAKTHEWGLAKNYLSRVPTGRRVWILTACRNPFKFLVSVFWEQFKAEKFEWMKGLKGLKGLKSVNVILEHFGEESKSHDVGSWFGDIGFPRGVGLNLTACGGKFSEGSLYIDRVVGGVRQSIVLLRMEDIKRWPAILGKYMPGFRLAAPKNTRDQQRHHRLADAFDKRWVWREEDMKSILRWDTWEFYTVQEKIAMLRDSKMNHSKV